MTLDKPARIGSTVFGTGVSWETVILRAQREYKHFELSKERSGSFCDDCGTKFPLGSMAICNDDGGRFCNFTCAENNRETTALNQ